MITEKELEQTIEILRERLAKANSTEEVLLSDFINALERGDRIEVIVIYDKAFQMIARASSLIESRLNKCIQDYNKGNYKEAYEKNSKVEITPREIPRRYVDESSSENDSGDIDGGTDGLNKPSS